MTRNMTRNMTRKILHLLLITILIVSIIPTSNTLADSWEGEVVTIDEAWFDSFENKINDVTGYDLFSVKELNITAGELTDDDVMWISKNLENLETLKITGNATFADYTIPDYAFSNYFEKDEWEGTEVGTKLYNLKSVTIDINDIHSLQFGNYIFDSCYRLIDACITEESSFGDEAFQSCRELMSVSLPETTSYGMLAFNDCDALTSISLPKAISFGDMAFQSCDKLKNVSLPEATTFIGSEFMDCTALTDIELPKAINLGGYAFSRCPILKNIVLPSATTFYGNAFEDCTALENISLPEATTFLYDAFKGCTSLTSVNLPKVTEFGDTAFKNCTALENISLPETGTFGKKAFEKCTTLTSVNLPKVTALGDGAFTDCDKSITMTLGATPPANSNVFSNYNPTDKGTPTIIIPKDAVATYDSSSTGLWYGWTINKTAIPKADPNGGFFGDFIDVTLTSATEGANIFYTLDGSEPTTESLAYTSPIKIIQTTTLKAIATALDLYNSNVMTVSYTKGYKISYKAGIGGSITGEANQLVAPNANGVEVTATPDPGYEFLKWNDGLTTASRTDTKVTGDISVIAEFVRKTATPTASPNGGTFTGSTEVTLVSATTGANIYYTLDGSKPTTESTAYTSPITINQTTTLKAIATAPKYLDSEICTVTFTIKSGSSGSGSSGSHNNIVKGKADDTSFEVGTQKTKYNSEAKKEIIVATNDNAIKRQVNMMSEGERISIPVIGESDISKEIFSVQSVKDMQEKNLLLEMKSENATYELPTGVIDVNVISDKMGKEVALADITFTITISKTSNEMTKVVESAAEEGELSIVVPSVDFEIEATHKNKTYKIDKFNAFVTRLIEIPSNVDASKITTAIITEADGSIRHVPTYITIIDGKYYAEINSLTNSTYTLIYNEAVFPDVTDNHWAKEDIEKMASRLVLEGKEDGTFLPDANITRAELAKIIVKALGLKAVEIDKFCDVERETEYAGYIGTAYSYGILKGTSETTFNPYGLVARQDAITMIYRASKIAGFVGKDNKINVNNYEDYIKISDYAIEAVVWSVNNDIIVGRTDTTLVPQGNITRAELSAVINRFLMSAGLIDKQ